MTNDEKDKLLHDWMELNRRVMEMTEAEVRSLLDHEQKNRARLRVMLRLLNRMSKLRATREKAEIAKHAKA